MGDTYQVVTNEQRARVLFDGPQDEAKAFVERNFPRLHADPGSNYGDDGPPPDVMVKSPDNTMTAFRGGVWDDEKNNDEHPDDVLDDDEME